MCVYVGVDEYVSGCVLEQIDAQLMKKENRRRRTINLLTKIRCVTPRSIVWRRSTMNRRNESGFR
jgi:hypothetical protein